MRSRYERLNSLLGDLSDPANPNRRLSYAEIHRFAQAERAIAMGEAIGDGLLWLLQAARRLRAAWSRPARARGLARVPSMPR